MHPGKLVADIGHLKEAFVQPGCPQCLPEKRFMGPGRTCGNHHSIEIFLQYAPADQVLGVLGTGKKGLLHKNDVRKRLGIPRHIVYVDYLSNV